MSQKRVDKYIRIEESGASPTGKTRRWKVLCRNEVIGGILWYGGWRKYVFQATDVGFYDEDFMYKVGLFCGMRTREHLAALGRGKIKGGTRA